MKSVSLTAYPRTKSRRAGTRDVRNAGRVPAVIYGRGVKPENVEIGARDLELLVHGSVSENVLLDLTLGGGKRLALVQEIQHHPLSGKPLHVDLHQVDANEKVTIMVPVEPVGEAAGVKTGGGTLEHVLFKLKVRALPKDLPEVINVDVSALEIGKAIHIGDITPPAGVEILGDKHISVLAVAAPVTEAAETAATAEGAAATQPEMIKEKKDDAAAAPAAGKGDAKADAKGGDKAGGDKKAAEKKK